MAHHLLVAVVLLSACLILVVDATSKPNAEESKKVDGEASGSNPSKDTNASGDSGPLDLLVDLEQYLGQLETKLILLQDSDPNSEETKKTFQAAKNKLIEAREIFEGLSKVLKDEDKRNDPNA